MKKFTLVLAILIAIGINAIGQAGWNMVGSGLPADKGVGQISIGMNDNTAMWGMAINSDGTIYDAFTRSIDGGNTWEAGTFNAGDGLSMLFAFDADVCWAVFNTGATQGLYKTVDGGANWVKKGGVYGSSSFANVIHFFNDNDGFAQGDPVGADYELYTTTDGGETWDAVDGDDIPLPTAGEYGITGNYCAVGDNIWWGTNQGRIYRSNDKGYTWEVSLTAFGNTNVVSPLMFDADNGIVFRSYLDMGVEPILNETTDGGATWTSFNTEGASYARFFAHVPGTVNTIYGSAHDEAAGEGISISDDGGHTWTELASGYPFMASAWLDMETGWCGTLSSGDGTDGMYIYDNTPPPPGPENVEATVENLNDVHVDWDAPNSGPITGFSDDFESYEDFVLEFAPWTNIDVDGSPTYGFNGVDWPNSYDPQAFILFNPSMTIPAIEDIVPHSGDKLAACFAAVPSPTNDDWLISPQILIESGDELSFWVKSYTDDYGLERYNVGISTTGMDPADFTIVSGGSYLEAPVEDWGEYTYDLSSYVGDDIYVGIQCVSNDAFIFLVDDFSVGSTKSNITYNSNTAVTGNAVKDIDVNAVPGKPNTVFGGPNATKSVLEGYNVMRDGEEIAYVEIPTTEYDDMDLAPGTYEYCVIAIYDDGESFEECADPVTVNPTAPPPAPTDLEADIDGDDIVLTWDAPGGEWMQWDSGENNGNGIGLNGGGIMTVSSHWDPASLEDYFGLSITQIQFFANADPDAVYTIKVWIGSDGSNEVLSQDVASFEVDEWNVVDLNTPVTIDGTQDLWFGYAVDHGADMFPAGCDDGPAIAGYGDMILQGSVWESLVGLAPDLDFNWNLAAYVETADGGSKLMGKAITPAESGSYAASGSTGVTTKMSTAGSKAFDEYNVYYSIDGDPFILVASPTETTFTHTDGATITGEHCYKVTAVYDPEGESDPTNEVCVVITSVPEFLQEATAVYPNPASDVVNITSDFEIELIRVYNHAGQIVTDQVINRKMYQLNTSEFNPGLYLFQIETTEGTITERIIIQ